MEQLDFFAGKLLPTAAKFSRALKSLTSLPFRRAPADQWQSYNMLTHTHIIYCNNNVPLVPVRAVAAAYNGRS